MGGTQRVAAVAAVAAARHHYNHTQPVATQDATPYGLNVLFVSATMCGVMVAICAACWRRSPAAGKPDDALECRGVYTVSRDVRLHEVQDPLHGPPPAYDTVVDDPTLPKDDNLQEVVTEDCPGCHNHERRDSGLPSYEAAVLLKDTKL